MTDEQLKEMVEMVFRGVEFFTRTPEIARQFLIDAGVENLPVEIDECEGEIKKK